jgi:glyoxylase-like metal-dependent hydrolase (beta-lactamase superfamily II)
MTTYYELTPIVVGVFPAFPLRRFLDGYQGDDVVEAPCIAWLGRGSDGSSVLVDTGPPVPTDFSSTLHVGLEVRPEHRVDAALRQAGVDPAEIDTVVFTHLHFDHCAHAEHLPNARVVVQRDELRYAVAPLTEHRRGYEVGYPGLRPAWTSAFGQLDPVDGVAELSDGCTVLPLPGHTPGSCGVVFRTRKGRFCVAGDLVSRVENWRSPSGEHIAPTLKSSLAECHDSFRLLEREADVVLASHDSRMLSD